MFRRSLSRWAVAAAVLVFVSGAQSAFAQSLFGGGQTQTGGGGQPASSSGSIRSVSPASGFTGSFGGTAQGGGLNTGGLNTGAGAAGQTGLTGPQISTELGALSATVGQGGFVGRADNAGRFVGNANAGQQSIQGTNVTGGGGQFGNRGQGQGGFNQQNNFNQQTRRTVRPQQKIAFTYPQRAQAAIETNLNSQFQRLQTRRPELQDVQIQLAENSVVILRGAVRSEDDKKLAAMLAGMEPGVRSVQNELAIEAN